MKNLNQIDTRPDSGKMLITGQLDEPADVTLFTNSNPAVDADVDIDDVFRAYVDVTDGSNTMTITATDKSGNNNQTTTNYSFTVDADTFTDPVYDEDGNMLEDGTGRSFIWDQESRLKRINYVSGEYTTFAYNASSQRVRKTEHNSSGTPTSDIAYIWCGGTQPCEARDFGTQTTVLARYYPQGEERIGGADAGEYYYFKDHLGSISEMVDSSENVRAQYEYDPYGRQSGNLITTSPLEAQFGYTGHFQHNQSGLVLTWYRAYDPELGIWLSRDPIAENGGLNLYAYVGNSPISLWDPFGLEAELRITIRRGGRTDTGHVSVRLTTSDGEGVSRGYYMGSKVLNDREQTSDPKRNHYDFTISDEAGNSVLSLIQQYEKGEKPDWGAKSNCTTMGKEALDAASLPSPRLDDLLAPYVPKWTRFVNLSIDVHHPNKLDDFLKQQSKSKTK